MAAVPRLIAALLTATLLALAGCGSSDTKDSSGGSTISADAGAAAAKTAPAATTPAETTPAAAAGPCKTVQQPTPGTRKASKPTTKLDKAKTYTVVLATSCGTIEFALDVKHDPKTAANVASLVRARFYDGLSFHRVVPGFVIQGGDPQGNGSGGVDYKVVEAPPAGTKYTKGVVAMAKTGTDAPGTSGSQFFIVTGDDAGLPAEYAVAGKVTRGQDVADAIAALGQQGGDGPPSQPVVITRATLKTS